MTKQNKRKSCSTARLNKKQTCFLKNLANSVKFTGEKRLLKTEVLNCVVCMARILDIDVEGVKTEKELKERFLDAFVSYK